jgi:hypothetical protein
MVLASETASAPVRRAPARRAPEASGVAANLVLGAVLAAWCAAPSAAADTGAGPRACQLLVLDASGSGDDTVLSWNEPPGAESYCVELGDLGVLLATGGDFRASIMQELASHTTTTFLVFVGSPAPGEGYWFLVKDNPAGSFDSGCPSQVGSRDEEISSAGDVCVN